jgi:hypothetical protein
VTLVELYQNQFKVIPFFANRLLNKFWLKLRIFQQNR